MTSDQSWFVSFVSRCCLIVDVHRFYRILGSTVDNSCSRLVNHVSQKSPVSDLLSVTLSSPSFPSTFSFHPLALCFPYIFCSIFPSFCLLSTLLFYLLPPSPNSILSLTILFLCLPPLHSPLSSPFTFPSVFFYIPPSHFIIPFRFSLSQSQYALM